MKGIVLLSHGSLARGLADAATFFMGDSIEQLEYCCLRQDSSPDEFAEELKRAIEKVDTGEGAVILADLFGGTPCNQAARLLADLRWYVEGGGLTPPQTGVAAQVGLWAAVGAAALLVLFLVLLIARRRKEARHGQAD